jgi:hypothetical protein
MRKRMTWLKGFGEFWLKENFSFHITQCSICAMCNPSAFVLFYRIIDLSRRIDDHDR